ncbi:MAG: ornithine--oxo-acid transaminase [Planctomycetes bacterium]|nr:ornithine--oxo-acid transaminase [Planctomycetota bacterium]
MQSNEFIRLEQRFGAANYRPLDVVISRARGVWVWDVEGNRYLDCLAAYSAVNQGHCHPRIVQALHEQADRCTLTSRAFFNDQLGPFYEQLSKLLGYEKVLPMNTGAEAVETAIKAARRYGYRQLGIADQRAEVLVFDGNFHGRTTTIVGFSGEAAYRDGFGPFAPGFRRLPYGDAAAVEQAMGQDVCAVLVEPIQGEAGIVVPPEGFLRRLRAACDRRGALLIADEIQSGLGRTGRLLCCEHEGVRPDLVILGKALSGGCYPVSAVVGDDRVLSVFEPGSHGSTYGGNPLGAAVARAALHVLVDDGLCANSAELGAYALQRLSRLSSPKVAQVRGRGLWIGIEVNKATGGARPFCEELRRRGLLCKETHDYVIRFAPPLCITRDELDWALDRLEAVLR